MTKHVHFLLQYLSLVYRNEVGRQFHSWLKTMKAGISSTEWIATDARRSNLFEFHVHSLLDHEIRKILVDNMTVYAMLEYQIAAERSFWGKMQPFFRLFSKVE